MIVQESLYSLGNVAVGIRLAEMTGEEGEVQAKLLEPGMQKILGRLISTATLLGNVTGFTAETRAQANDVVDLLGRLFMLDEPVQTEETLQKARPAAPNLTLL